MEKQIFDTPPQPPADEANIQPKQLFDSDQVEIEPDAINSALGGEKLADLAPILQPKPSGWKKILGVASLLFFGAVVAQTLQWFVASWQQNQWIDVAFGGACLALILATIQTIFKEWRTLVRLKRRTKQRQQSEQLWQPDHKQPDDGEKGKELCYAIAQNMGLDPKQVSFVQWQQQISDAHSAQEVAYLFSQHVLADLDQQAKQAISKSAAEATLIVAVSPLALVDMLFVAWRNLRLINQIARIYGIELGYFSRIRLLRMVLINMAFAGATELIHEIGLDWLSQDIAAKLSARAAQGLGVGLLTARLGIKTMEFCRPLRFQPEEKPRLTLIHKQLLTTLKTTVLTKGQKNKQNQPDYSNKL